MNGLADWLQLLLFQLSISLLAVGGAMSLAPDLHRFLVLRQGWLADTQFSQTLTLAQVAPGPNALYIGLLGWHLGTQVAVSHGGGGLAHTAWGLLGLLVCLGGALLPSSVLTYWAARWGHRHRDRRAVQAFRQGMATLVAGLMLSTAWLLGDALGAWQTSGWRLGLLAVASTLLIWRTRLHLMLLLAVGAVLGALGVV